jgi:hypothetical protein
MQDASKPFRHDDNHERRPEMARRFLSKLTRSLTAEWAPTPGAGVHFHGGAHGRPYPCHDPRCTSPGLDPSER